MGWDLEDLGNAIVSAAEATWEGATDLAEDAWDAASGTIEDAVDLVTEAGEKLGQAVEDALDAVGDALGRVVEEIAEGATDVWEAASRIAETAWENAAGFVDTVADAFSKAAEDAWEAVSDSIEAAWNELDAVVSDALDAAVGWIEEAWEKIDASILDALIAVEANWEMMMNGIASVYESALALVEATLLWVGDFIEDIVHAIQAMGACVAGRVIYAAAKLFNSFASFSLGSLPKRLPEEFRARLGPLFGAESFDNVHIVEHAILSADWFSDDTEAMTFGGVSFGGSPFNYVVFLRGGFAVNYWPDRSLVAHELVHVRQIRRFGSEGTFACLYGIGYWEADFTYEDNFLEAEAFEFERVNAQLIKTMI